MASQERVARRRPVAGTRSHTAVAVVPEPDHAWKALALVNEWIRHSDSKAGVTLAFVGVMSTVTFNLATKLETRSAGSDILIVAACTFLIATAAFCGLTLTPRTKDRDADDAAINRLFYGSIAAKFKGERPRYVDVLRELTADPRELIRDLADQVHANARIATIKARWATWAIRAALLAGTMIAALAAVVGVTNS